MEKIYDVLCIGLLNANLPVKPVNRNVFDIDVTLVDEIDILPGGDAMNEAITLSRLGNRVGLVGMVGKDYFGEIVLNVAKEAGVDTANVNMSSNAKTSVSIMLINEKGDRNFAVYRGANTIFSTEDFDLSIIRKARIVNIGSIFANKRLTGDKIEAIFKEARENSVITSADMKYDTYKMGFDSIKCALRYTDYFLPSYDEAAYLTNEKDPVKMGEALLDTGVKNVVIKLGEDGSYIATQNESFFVEPYKTKAIDTTGAGDNFVAGFLTGILKSWDLKKCGMFANAVGSICVQHVGPTGGVKSMEQVLRFMGSFENSNI